MCERLGFGERVAIPEGLSTSMQRGRWTNWLADGCQVVQTEMPLAIRFYDGA
jgi:hypothetical protein